MALDARMHPPSRAYPFGTNEFGQDVLDQIIYGARVEIIVSFASVLLGVMTGFFTGLVSGYFGGWLDDGIQRIVDALMSLPLLLLALAIVTVMGPSPLSVIIAIGVPISARASRVIRSAVIAIKENDFVMMAKTVGCSNWRILWRHLAPQCVPTFLVVTTVWLSSAILAEAALSYLGFGPAPPFVSWGQMLSNDAVEHFHKAPWLAVFPGLAISMLIYGVNMLGDTVRDAMDPRLRNVIRR